MLVAMVALATAQAPSPAPLAHHAIGCRVAGVQDAVDRGLAFAYAFNVGEARTMFAHAAELDPGCAPAYWGEALADTIDINEPQTADGDRRGARAMEAARVHRAAASAEDAALIDALSLRYTSTGTVDSRFEAYAAAMARVATAYPNDADVLTLAAYARWNALDEMRDASGAPVAGALEIERDLDAALKLDPANIGAHHLRIHAEEEMGRPAAALANARALDEIAFPPGMSHLAHMTGHIYTRVGDYERVIASNQRAVANDAAYFAQGDGAGQHYMHLYHDHDLDFVAYGLTTLGRDAEARAAVAHEDESMRLAVALRTRDAQAVALAAGGDRVAERVIALVQAGRLDAADALLPSVPTGKSAYGKARALIASAVVQRAHWHLDEAAAAYRKALALRGRELGDPKFMWPYPPGEGLGEVLLAQANYAEAERVFRDELTAYPNDPRLAFGLAEAEQALGHDDNAERAIAAHEWHGGEPLSRSDLF